MKRQLCRTPRPGAATALDRWLALAFDGGRVDGLWRDCDVAAGRIAMPCRSNTAVLDTKQTGKFSNEIDYPADPDGRGARPLSRRRLRRDPRRREGEGVSPVRRQYGP